MLSVVPRAFLSGTPAVGRSLSLLALGWLPSAAFAQVSIPASSAPHSVTFASEVAPILARHCLECHHEGGDGPFSLVTFDEAHRRARLIADVVRSRFMPPWKPAHGVGPALTDERALNGAEIAILTAWVEAGALPGDLRLAPPAPTFASGWKLGPPDLVVELPEAYMLPAAGKDVYRNFVIPLPLTGPRFVRALEFSPQSRLVIHHAVMLFDATGSARALDRLDAGLGFAGMEFGDATNPGGHFVGWSPGQVPYQAYPGTAWRVDPGTDLVLQLHLLPTGKMERIRPRVALYFSDTPPTRTSTVVQLSEPNIAIPAGAPSHVIEQRFVLPVAASVLGMYPHAHYLAKDFQLFAELPNGQRQWLLRIPDWDFNWQRDYRFAEPLALPAGAQLVMRTQFDNSTANPRNPSHPPRDVVGGWNSTDEMSEAAIQLLLQKPEDLEKIRTAQVLYAAESAGGVANYSFNLGLRWQRKGQLAEAAQAYALAVQKDPRHAGAHQRLAGLADDAGRMEEALLHYRAAHAAEPENAGHALNLVQLLGRVGRDEEAERLLAETVSRQPGNAALNLEWGIVSAKARKWAQAQASLRVAAINGEGLSRAEAYRVLAFVALATGDEEKAVTELAALLSLEPALQPEIATLVAGLPTPRGVIALVRASARRGDPQQHAVVLAAARARFTQLGRSEWLPLLEAASASTK